MGFAIELYFDEATEKSLREMRAVLTRSGIRPVLDELGDRPHISLAVFSQPPPEDLQSRIKSLALQYAAFSVRLNGVGSFPAVVFLRPEILPKLIKMHGELHRALKELGVQSHAYYLPEKWVPHCTMAQDVEAQDMSRAMEAANKHFKPLTGEIREIGMVHFRPVQPLCTFPLTGILDDIG